MDRSKIKKLLIGRFTILRLIRSVVPVYAVIIIIFYFCADQIIFLPRPSSYEDGPDILKIKTKTDTQISALYLPDPNAEFIIIYSHGNAEDIGNIRFILERFNLNGFSVFAYDYQGYGTSGGRPSEKKAYQDIEAAYKYITNQLNIHPDRIIAMGRSIGSAVATHLASQYQIAGLILESPLTSAFRMITHIPLSPIDKFNNFRNIKKIDCPVLIIHGTDDRIIPIWHGRKLFEKANEPKFKLWVENAGHNDDISQIAGTAYWRKIRQLTIAITEKQKE
ncbi:MAG: alpha/beta hydrolase [Planctomycetes bacterium]|nr:alpha/beta hydrolase [Planctomycetota bacterium]